MTIKFEFDSDGFKRNLQRDMERSANELMRQSASELQSAFDSVLASHGGHPVDEVKPALTLACQRHDFTFDEDDLTAYATAISEGTRIVVETQDVRLH
jgi:hypothetical protein